VWGGFEVCDVIFEGVQSGMMKRDEGEGGYFFPIIA